MRVALVLALAAQLASAPTAAAAEPPPAQDRGVVSTAQLVLPDGTTSTVHGGCWMDARVCVATGRELTALRNETAALRAENTALRVGFVVAAILAATAGGFALHAHLTAR